MPYGHARRKRVKLMYDENDFFAKVFIDLPVEEVLMKNKQLTVKIKKSLLLAIILFLFNNQHQLNRK